MEIRELLTNTHTRTRLLGVMYALALILAFPNPSSVATSRGALILSLLWIAALSLAWVTWFKPEYVKLVWFVSFIFSFLVFWQIPFRLPLFLIMFWGWWFYLRSSRESRLGLLFMAIVSISVFRPIPSFAGSTGPKDINLGPVPKYLTGYNLRDLVSCGMVDQIPWKFKPDGKKTRLLLKDSLRLNTETKFSNWEIYQVLDDEGYVSYIFRRVLANGRYESIIVKDSVYNRILDTAKGQKIVEKEDLKSLINRPAVTFVHEDGSTVSYSPSSIGRSSVTVQLAPNEGRLLPPIFLRGNFCDKPNDEENIDTTARSQQMAVPMGSSAPAAAAVAPGAPK